MAKTRAEQERRALLVVTGLAILGVLFMLISIATDYWVILHIPNGVYRNSSRAFVKSHHSGLWRICRREVNNFTSPIVIKEHCRLIRLFPNRGEVRLNPEIDVDILQEFCHYIKLFPKSSDVFKNPEVDVGILHYSRTETAFAVISLMMMALGLVFSVYSIKEPRYMFKRLAALMHLITAICILVSAEVLVNSVNYERQNLPARHPEGAHYTYGFSFVLAWITFAIYVIATIVFAFCSRKRKGDRAETEKVALENEPVHLGR